MLFPTTLNLQMKSGLENSDTERDDFFPRVRISYHAVCSHVYSMNCSAGNNLILSEEFTWNNFILPFEARKNL